MGTPAISPISLINGSSHVPLSSKESAKVRKFLYMGSGAINVMVLPNFNHSFDTSLSTCTSEAGVVGIGGVTTLPCCLLHVGLKL
jgi:hypothetical protein